MKSWASWAKNLIVFMWRQTSVTLKMLPLSWSYRSPRHSSTYNTPPKAKNITTTRMTMLDIKHVDPLPLCNHTNTVINRCWRTLSSPVSNNDILSMFPRQLIGRVSYLIPTGTPTFSNFRRHRVYALLAVSEVWKCDSRLSYIENTGWPKKPDCF